MTSSNGWRGASRGNDSERGMTEIPVREITKVEEEMGEKYAFLLLLTIEERGANRQASTAESDNYQTDRRRRSISGLFVSG